MARSTLFGQAGSPGVGVGRLLPVDGHAPTRDGAADRRTLGTAAERERLEGALDLAATELAALAHDTASRAGAEVGAIFEAQALFARDPGIVGPAIALIESGVGAAEAIMRATGDQADVLAAVDDEYFRERAADVRDVGRRVAAIVSGATRPDLWHQDGRPAIVVAHDLDPSSVATLRRELVAGIALAGGAPTGHAAIVARALGIPLVLGLGPGIDGLRDDVDGLVDGASGRLLICPTEAEVEALVTADADRVAPAVEALDTHGVAVTANVSSALEADAAVLAGAAGIGLVRTELLFLGRQTPPGVAEQRRTYRRIMAAMGDRPVVFRTLDVGGDKPAPWHHGPPEANPALGVRGLRLGLRRPEILDEQLEALVGAAGAEGRELRVMLPMVSTRQELDDARGRLSAVVARCEGAGDAGPTSIQLGVMIEVPSAALTADALAEAADFFSIGTNDLVQYTMAADRTNAELTDLASALQPAVLRLIGSVVRAARARGRHVAVCGESAADPTIVPLLIGLGVEELSVAPSSVAVIRSVVAGLDVAACRARAEAALLAGTLEDVRAILG